MKRKSTLRAARAASLRPGFALPAALLATAALALGLAMALPSDEQAARELHHARARVALDQAAVSIEARLAFLLSSEPAGLRGIEVGAGRLAADGTFISPADPGQRREVVFDARPYAVTLPDGRSYRVRIQDEAGLPGLASAPEGLLARLAQACRLDPSLVVPLARASLRRANLRPRATDAGEAAALASLPPRWKAAISTTMDEDRPRFPTAPATVLLALSNGNLQTVSQINAMRDSKSFTANVNAFNSHNDDIVPYRSFRWGSLSDNIRIYIEPNPTSLRLELPLYYYTTTLTADREDSRHSFMVQGSVINAGRKSQCHESPGEVVVPLPYPGRPVS